MEYVVEIKFVDRFGLGYEIFEVVKNKKLNLLAMEATADFGMMIKLESPGMEKVKDLIDSLKEIKGVTEVNIRQHLECEQREHELRTVLNSVNEGIVAVDSEGRITHINRVACLIFHCSRHEVIGKKLDDILTIKTPLQNTIETGLPYTHQEIKMKTEQGDIHFITSGVPILNEKGEVIGGVGTIQNYRHVEEMISKVGRKHLTTFEDIIYQSAKMKKVVETAKTVAMSKSTVLLRGESGTGKELFARAIHMESNRADAPFIAINCAALPDSLLESELFGYEDGAFTGALKGGKKGLFEQAHGGTLFLDEIGEISPQVQVRLLRVLQESTVRRVGGTKEISLDVRIIAATHRNLEEMIRKEQFREDLYYRLNVIPLRIPPLRERVEDIPLIAQHLVRKICSKLNRPEICLTQETLEFLMRENWRGNVRQLENLLERVINVIDINQIRPDDFYEWANIHPLDPDYVDESSFSAAERFALVPAKAALNAHAPTAAKKSAQGDSDVIYVEIPLGKQLPQLKTLVRDVEKQILLSVLQKYPSSRKAGKMLGVSGTTILNKINAYGIDLERNTIETSS